MKKAKRRFQASSLEPHASRDDHWKQPAHGQVRVYVWEWPVRFAHWILVGTVASLSITGYYMHAPYIVPYGKTAYVMGTMRFIHVLSGFALLGALLIRVVWMFIGNRWSRWDQLIPTTKQRFKDLLATGKYYGFMAWEPTPHIGHNGLAGLAYAAVFGMAGLEIVTGFTLYSQTLGSPTLTHLVGWIPRVLDIQWLREIHFLTMFGLWMFFIHHLYTAILVSVEEQNGVMESIFSGYKFVPEHELQAEMNEAASGAASPPARTVPGAGAVAKTP
jgi:Ni/Fe-hydrogenase 1 B-type cytochrome subunit